MAAPAHPRVITDLPNGVTRYQSLDDIDETIYNSLAYQYEKAAFIDMITEWHGQFASGFTGVQVPLVNGNGIRNLWIIRKRFKVPRRKKSHMRPKPVINADPPLPAPVIIAPIAPTLGMSIIQSVVIQAPVPQITMTPAPVATQSVATQTQSLVTSTGTQASGSQAAPVPQITISSASVITQSVATQTETVHTSTGTQTSAAQPTASQQPAPPQSTVQQTSGTTQTDQTQATAQVDTNASAQPDNGQSVSTPSSRRSSSDGGEIEPCFVRINNPDLNLYLPSTKEERRMIAEGLTSVTSKTPWRFAGMLAQGETYESDTMLMPIQSNYLFVYVDSNGLIQDQVAVKCVDSDDEEKSGRAQTEIEVNESLNRTNRNSILGYRGHYKGSYKVTLRGNLDTVLRKLIFIFTDLEPFGDLKSLCRVYSNLATQQNGPGRIPVPECFIWYTMRCLVNSLITLKNGEPPAATSLDGMLNNMHLDNWRSILHLDIKDENIFLLEPSDEYSSYPRPVLSDFDLALIRGDGKEAQARQDKEAQACGTRGWLPLERNVHAVKVSAEGFKVPQKGDDYPPHGWEINEKTDIFGVGLIVLNLTVAHLGRNMANAVDEIAKRFAGLKGAWGDHPDIDNFCFLDSGILIRSDDYSPNLYKVIDSCIRLRPTLRVGLLQLSEQVTEGLQNAENKSGAETEKKRWADYGIGKQYLSARKRRKISLPDDISSEYGNLVERWADTARYPRPTSAEQATFINSLERQFITWKNRGRPETLTLDEQAQPLALRHLLAMIRKRAAPSTPVEWNVLLTEDKAIAFSRPMKLLILEQLEIRVSMALKASTLTPTEAKMLNTFEHTIAWGVLLLKAKGEPRPLLEDHTLLHRGVYDWVFPESGILIRYMDPEEE